MERFVVAAKLCALNLILILFLLSFYFCYTLSTCTVILCNSIDVDNVFENINT